MEVAAAVDTGAAVMTQDDGVEAAGTKSKKYPSVAVSRDSNVVVDETNLGDLQHGGIGSNNYNSKPIILS